MIRLFQEMEKWSQGALLERRAVIAGICEPRLLNNDEVNLKVLEILHTVTEGILHEDQRKTDEFIALKKALGYSWSVVVVSAPEAGKSMMEKWMQYEDKEIKWIMKENLKKNRMQKLDPQWTEQWLSKLQKS